MIHAAWNPLINGLSMLWAAARILLVIITMLFTVLLVFLLSLIPLLTRNGIQIAAWPAVWQARFFLWICNVDFQAPDAHLLRQHRGLVFCNHLSYMDILCFVAVLPVRFLSTAGVRKIPLIGRMAAALGTIFVRRNSQESRSAVREQMVHALTNAPYPPLVLFPEGRIGPGDAILPFRYGAFAVAMDIQQPILLCFITYRPLDAVHYYDPADTLWTMAWRLARQQRPVRARLSILGTLDPADGFTDEKELAKEAEKRIGVAVRDLPFQAE